MTVFAARTAAAALVALALACRPIADERTPDVASSEELPFSDASAAVGLDFVHENGMSGRFFFPEMMGPGGALADLDGDGDLDLYLVQGGRLGAGTGSDSASARPAAASDRIYRNDLQPSAKGVLRFTDITGASRLEVSDYGMGVAAGDVDNDGDVDLYVTAFGANRLLLNRGDATFVDGTEAAGVGEGRWSVSALFFDYDRDGWLDLYVGNYLDYTLATDRACYDPTGARDYCGPQAYRGVADRLFRNRGDGAFEDASLASGIGRERGKGLGAVTADFDADGWPDLYVANDGEPNRLWRNRGDGTFEEQGLYAGCALDLEGRAEASMGVDAGDGDADGDLDLVVTHLTGETNAFYRNRGDGLFDDRRRQFGLGPPSVELTGFGAAWLDYDLDGLLDLAVSNGAVRHLEERLRAGDPYPLDQPKQLFRNRGDGTFEETTASAGPPFTRATVGRGLAVGDVDNDGDLDLLAVNNSGAAQLLLNQERERRPERVWIGLRLVGSAVRRDQRPEQPRDQLGALAVVEGPGSPPRLRRAASDGSYASARDPRVLVGLGGEVAPVEVQVLWPSGRSERFFDLEPGRYHTLAEGDGEPIDRESTLDADSPKSHRPAGSEAAADSLPQVP